MRDYLHLYLETKKQVEFLLKRFVFASPCHRRPPATIAFRGSVSQKVWIPVSISHFHTLKFLYLAMVHGTRKKVQHAVGALRFMRSLISMHAFLVKSVRIFFVVCFYDSSGVQLG